MTQQVERMLPLYEAKMVGPYNHRAADVVRSATAVKRQNQPAYLTAADLCDPRRVAIPASWVREELVTASRTACRLGFLRISSATNARTFTGALLPCVAIGDSIFLVEIAEEVSAALLLAQMNSFVFDYVVRQKLAGLNLNFFYVEQFPFLSPQMLDTELPWGIGPLKEWLSRRAMGLTLTAIDMLPLAEAIGSRIIEWESESRVHVMTELDAAMFHLFGIERDDVDYIMDTFPIVKRKDETAYGSYRTKELILRVYDAMQDAIDSGEPYVSPFDEELSVPSDMTES